MASRTAPVKSSSTAPAPPGTRTANPSGAVTAVTPTANSAKRRREPEQLRVGVVGLGMGATHLAAFAGISGVSVTALAGRESERLAELGAQFKVPRLYADWEDLVALPELDIVSIATPNALHHPIAVAALSAGKHVFCEKPLATSVAEAREMVAAARSAGRVLDVAFNQRRRADIQFAKRYLDEVGIGRVYHVRATWKRRRGIPGLHSWFTSRSLAGGGALIDLGPHVLDAALFLLGEPRVTTVSAVTHGELGRAGYGAWDGSGQMAGESGQFEVEDLASALLRLDSGASVAMEISWAGHTVDDEDISIELLGVDGGLRVFIPRYAKEGTVTVFREEAGAPVTIRPEVRVLGGEHPIVIGEFVEKVRSNDWARHDGEFALHRTAVLEACYQSASSGQEVSVGA